MLPLALLLLALSLAVNVRQLVSGRKDARRMAELEEGAAAGHARIVTRYIHDSIEHVIVKEVAVKSNAEKTSAIGSPYLDTLTRAIKVAAGRIDEVTRVNAKLVAENVSLRKAATGNRYEYQDKWLSLSYSADSSRLDVNYNVSLNIAKYWKRKWFVAPRQYYIDLYSDDPRVRINEVKRFTLATQGPKRFGFGFSAGLGYLPFSNQWQPFFGVGLNYNLIEF